MSSTVPAAPKKVLITHVYSSSNKGDAALTSVLIADIRRVFPHAEISILTLEQTREPFEGALQYSAFMQFPLTKFKKPLVKLAYTLYMLPVTLLWAWWFRRFGWRLPLPRDLLQTANRYVAADLVVAVGGGYIRSRKGLINRLNIPLLLHQLLFGYLLGKPTVLYAQSVGPFMNQFEPAMVAFVLRRMDKILLREDVSAALLKRLGVTKNVVRAVDSGFLLRSNGFVNIRQRFTVSKNTLLLGVTVRSWLSGAAQAAYEEAVAGALDTIVQQYAVRVLFVPQVTAANGDDDREASQRVHARMKHAKKAVVMMDDIDHHEIKQIYNELDLLLGTRFHSVIFSLTSFVPVVAIEYEHKTGGIMHDLNLDDWVIKIEQVTAQNIATLLQKLIASRHEYKNFLRAEIPLYVQRAERSAIILADTYAAAAASKTTSSDYGVVEV